MADVTINSAKYNVNGNLRDNFYNITGVTTNTLTVGMFNVRKIDTNPGSVITGIAVAPGTVLGTSTITLTSSGAITGEVIEVMGN